MASIGNDDVELEARSMLRDLIKRTAWFHHGMTEEQRQKAIEQDVDQHWPLLARDAARCLIDRLVQGMAYPKDEAAQRNRCG